MSIGEVLAEARRQAGLSVTQVSRQTRIRESIVAAIEGDDYSACGGDFYARGHIRSIAGAVGADPEPLIQEYDAARRGTHALPDDVTEPIAPIRTRQRRRPAEPVTTVERRRRPRLPWAAALGVALLAGLGLAVYLVAGRGHAAPPAGADRSSHHHDASQGPAASPTATQAASAPAVTTPAATAPRRLIPASVTAFGSPGALGDNSDLAPLAIDGSLATAWQTDWYTTARFGNLYPGTGLLVDMGRAVTITTAQITLGRARGASLQLRVGFAPALASLRPVAYAANAGGVVHLRLTRPAHGRYVLIWFTSLPPDPAGTFQESVHGLQLKGRT